MYLTCPEWDLIRASLHGRTVAASLTLRKRRRRKERRRRRRTRRTRKRGRRKRRRRRGSRRRRRRSREVEGRRWKEHTSLKTVLMWSRMAQGMKRMLQLMMGEWRGTVGVIQAPNE